MDQDQRITVARQGEAFVVRAQDQSWVCEDRQGVVDRLQVLARGRGGTVRARDLDAIPALVLVVDVDGMVQAVPDLPSLSTNSRPARSWRPVVVIAAAAALVVGMGAGAVAVLTPHSSGPAATHSPAAPGVAAGPDAIPSASSSTQVTSEPQARPGSGTNAAATNAAAAQAKAVKDRATKAAAAKTKADRAKAAKAMAAKAKAAQAKAREAQQRAKQAIAAKAKAAKVKAAQAKAAKIKAAKARAAKAKAAQAKAAAARKKAAAAKKRAQILAARQLHGGVSPTSGGGASIWARVSSKDSWPVTVTGQVGGTTFNLGRTGGSGTRVLSTRLLHLPPGRYSWVMTGGGKRLSGWLIIR